MTDLHKRAYVSGVRGVRAGLTSTGVMDRLDRWADESRTGLWVRSWFAVYDLDEMARLKVPWWTFDAADVVAAHLVGRPGARVLEWGSGSSTLWLADRAATVDSIEHDPSWAEAMRPRLPAHVTLHVVPPVPDPEPRTPSGKRGFEGLDFTDYVHCADDLPGSFDLVVVDGRAREACLTRAADRLAPDGLVVVDNVDRARYRTAIAELADRLTDRRGSRVEVTWTRGLTPSLPYPTRTALLRVRPPVAAP